MRIRLAVLPALAGLWAAYAFPGLAQVVNGPLPQPLPLFPLDNWWNVDVSAAPVDPNSASYVAFIGATRGLHPDFGGAVDPDDPANPEVYGMPFVSVPGSQPLEPVAFVEYDEQSDHAAPGRPAGYPIPVQARTQPRWIEGGEPGGGADGDHHLLIVDRDNRILYELWQAHWTGGHWEAGSGAIFALDGNGRRPETWTSADAAGLAILPGLVRYDEVYEQPGPIRHAFRFTVRATNGHVYPASHTACDACPASALPMGARLRLKAGVDISGFEPGVRKVFQAMKTYGLIVADNGSDLYIQGTYDARWNNDVLNPAFASLHAGDFEVVQLGWKPPVATSAGPLRFYTVPPCRVLDTRGPSGPYGGPALPPGGQRVVVVAGRCGIPATAKSISANVTIANAAAPGHLRFFPGNAQAPNASLINVAAGQTRANNAILMLASSGTGTLGVQSFTPGAATHVLLDVNGYFE